MDKQQLTDHLEDVLQDGYNFNIGDYIKEGWEIYKSLFAEYLGFTVLMILIMVFTSFIPFASVLLSAPLTAGFYLVAHKLKTQSYEGFSNFFDGFKFFLPLVLQSLVMVFVYIIIMLPFIFSIGFSEFANLSSGQFDPDSIGDMMNLSKSMLLLMIPIVFLSVSLTFAPFFILFFKQDFFNGIVYSLKFVMKNWIMVFLFLIVLMLIAIGGIFAILIGLLFVIPLLQTSMYSAFADMTRLYEFDQPSDDFSVEEI